MSALTVGGTPLVPLRNLFPGGPRVFAKLEGSNPSGSSKDRAAVAVLTEALCGATGPCSLQRGGRLVESSSGNFGIALAAAGRSLGLRVTIVIDPRTTGTNRALLRAYGADLEEVTQPDPETGEYLPARLKRVQEILKKDQMAWWPNQYGNRAVLSGHASTAREIFSSLGRLPDAVLVPVSTFGTFRGIAEEFESITWQSRLPLALRPEPSPEMIAVDAAGSVAMSAFGPVPPPRRRAVPGLGAAVVPDLAHGRTPPDRVIHVTDAEVVWGCRRLLDREGLLLGGSSGAAVAAIRKAGPFPRLAQVVIVCPDRGDRYLDNVYDPEWVRRNVDGDPEDPRE